ncbi:hypothetical protein ACE6H2_016011 [Prunus campanulata]
MPVDTLLIAFDFKKWFQLLRLLWSMFECIYLFPNGFTMASTDTVFCFPMDSLWLQHKYRLVYVNFRLTFSIRYEHT